MKRYLPVMLLLVLIVTGYLLGFDELLTFEALKTHHGTLEAFTAAHPLLSPLLFVAIYTAATALSLPGGAMLSITGGFLFPQPFSTLYVLVGATLGATLLFLIAKTAVGNRFKERANPRLERFQKGIKLNGASYLLFLRLVPLFPFWFVNLAPAFLGVAPTTFVWTTCVGIIPGAFVFTQSGAGIASILESEESFSPATLFTSEIKIALIALGIFALLPVILKKIGKQS